LQTWAIAHLKGGSGKTTTAVNLAAALGEKGKRVLIIDLDAQGSASTWVGVDPQRGLDEVFTANRNLADLVAHTNVPGVDAIPASPWLVGMDRALASEPGAEMILRNALRRLPATWDYVFLDTPPTQSVTAVSALVAADSLLVPVEASTMALAGLADLIRTVDQIADRLNPGLEVDGIVVCRLQAATNLSKDVVQTLQDRFGRKVFKTSIRETVRLREAPSWRKPITQYDPRGGAAEDFRALAGEFLKRRSRR